MPSHPNTPTKPVILLKDNGSALKEEMYRLYTLAEKDGMERIGRGIPFDADLKLILKAGVETAKS